MGKKNNNDKVRLEFIGGNAVNVTGSCIIGSFKGINFLLELGMVQGYSELECYKENWSILNHIDFKKINYIFVNHFHIDHTGLLCHAIAKGFKGKIICTYETAKMLKPLLEDSAHIIKDNCEWLRNTKGIKAIEYYKDTDITPTLNLIESYPLNIINKLNGLSFKLIPSNHVLGSCSLELYFKDNLGKIHNLFYSSDLGNTVVDKFFVYEDVKYSKKANMAIFESTYGSSNKKKIITKKMRKNDIKEIKNQILYTILEKQGTVLFPSFACDRQENLLVYIKQIVDSDDRLNDIPVIVDGKLSSKVIKVYSNTLQGEQKEQFDKILNWSNLKVVSSFEQTKMILADDKPKIILSSSGMCEKGRIIEYLKKLLPHHKNTIIFTGYAPDSSIGGKLKAQEQNTITIEKSIYKIKARIVITNSFSSHMQQQQLLDYMQNMKVSDGYVLVHGDKQCKEELANILKEKLSEQGRTTPVIVSKKGLVLYF